MSISLPNTLDKCGECSADFYGTHLKDCTNEEALELCSKCDQWYLNSTSPYVRACKCEREGER
jgi:hypothetical protein